MFNLICMVLFFSLFASSIAKPTKNGNNGFEFGESDSMIINPFDVSDSSFDPFGSIDFSEYSFLPNMPSVNSYVGYSDSSSSFDPFNDLVYYKALPYGPEYPFAGVEPKVTHPDVSVWADFARFPFPNDIPFPPVGVYPHLPTLNGEKSDNDADIAKNLIFGPDFLFRPRFPFPFAFGNPFGKNFPFAEDRSFALDFPGDMKGVTKPM